MFSEGFFLFGISIKLICWTTGLLISMATTVKILKEIPSGVKFILFWHKRRRQRVVNLMLKNPLKVTL